MAVFEGGLMNKAKGKAGNMVFRVINGQQVMSSMPVKSSDKKAPYTIQRSKLGNVVANYSVMKGKLRGCFEIKPAGQSDYNRFIGINMVNSKVYTSKAQNQTGQCILCPYQVSQGSITPVAYSKGVSDIKLGMTSLPEKVGDLADAIVNNNNEYEYGDQITVLVAYQYKDANEVWRAALKAYKVELLRDSDDAVIDVFGSDIKVSNKCLAVTLPKSVNAYAFIHTRVAGRKRYVSSQLLELSSTELMQLYNDPIAAGVTYDEAYAFPNRVNEPANTYSSDGSGSGSGSGGSGGSDDGGMDTGD